MHTHARVRAHTHTQHTMRQHVAEMDCNGWLSWGGGGGGEGFTREKLNRTPRKSRGLKKKKKKMKENADEEEEDEDEWCNG